MNEASIIFDSDFCHTIAWCGWSLPAHEDWLPLKIDGDWKRGSMMIGEDQNPVVLVKWWRPEVKKFDADKWIKYRFKRMRVLPDDKSPHPDGFNSVAWIKALHQKEDAVKTVWYGYSQDANLMIECISTSQVDDCDRKLVFEKMLPRLRASALDDYVDWSLFETLFSTPPGFKLFKRKLMLGDISLELRNDTGSRLILRQVYPAGLALKRRRIERWLDIPTFKERRYLRRPKVEQTENGMSRRGWKKLRIPMGWLRPLYSDAVAVTDVARDRLLIVDLQTRCKSDNSIVSEMIASMLRKDNIHV